MSRQHRVSLYNENNIQLLKYLCWHFYLTGKFTQMVKSLSEGCLNVYQNNNGNTLRHSEGYNPGRATGTENVDFYQMTRLFAFSADQHYALPQCSSHFVSLCFDPLPIYKVRQQ